MSHKYKSKADPKLWQNKEALGSYLSKLKELMCETPRLYIAHPIKDKLPSEGVWVTTIDIADNERVYKYEKGAWIMRDANGINSPNNNVEITLWLERFQDAKKVKTASECLFEYGINTMDMDDHFNGQLLHAMERYAEQFIL